MTTSFHHLSNLVRQLEDDHQVTRASLKSTTTKLKHTESLLSSAQSESSALKSCLTDTEKQLEDALWRIKRLENNANRTEANVAPVLKHQRTKYRNDETRSTKWKILVDATPSEIARLLDGLNVRDEDTKPFRFLDLPSEIRNQIYECAASAAFEVPAMMAYTKFSELRSRPWLIKAREATREASEKHDQHRGQHYRHRLAMLYTNRQIYGEASRIYYSCMTLDLRFMHLPATRFKVLELATIFKRSLQFVQHIELEYDMFDKITSPADSIEYWRFMWEPQSVPKSTVRYFLLLRTRLFSVKSVTAYHNPDAETYRSDGFALGVSFMYRLAYSDGSGRVPMERLFPEIQDIRLISRYGSERFRRSGKEAWELWYSGEKIQKTDYEEVVDDIDPSMHDATTGLVVKTTQAIV